MSTENSQTGVKLHRKYGTWEFEPKSYSNRMPWLGDPPALLTTYDGIDTYWWGTLIATGAPEYGTGPLVPKTNPMPKVYYWIRENVAGISLSNSLTYHTFVNLSLGLPR